MEKLFDEIYTKFKLHYYRKIFSRFEGREASLTAVETFCVEVIHALNQPTIKEFADFVKLSQANAAYKVQSLIKKGYVVKEQSSLDRREYTLQVTDKFYRYYNVSSAYIQEVTNRVYQHFSSEEIEMLEYFMDTIARELMPEITIKKADEITSVN